MAGKAHTRAPLGALVSTLAALAISFAPVATLIALSGRVGGAL